MFQPWFANLAGLSSIWDPTFHYTSWERCSAAIWGVFLAWWEYPVVSFKRFMMCHYHLQQQLTWETTWAGTVQLSCWTRKVTCRTWLHLASLLECSDESYDYYRQRGHAIKETLIFSLLHLKREFEQRLYYCCLKITKWLHRTSILCGP